jgi:CDP-diacylglycerol--glycerol-3-phosphate 3-phosphatidyltransferase
MTLANNITLTRILMIPVFVLFCVYYGRGIETGEAEQWQRWAAIITFILAAASDGVDGWVARRYGQRSKLGAILDPIADKGLLLTAIITLSFSKWTYAFPVWFPVLVIARDAVILVGFAVLFLLDQKLEVRVSFTGKLATAAQMVAIAWMMLQLPHYLVSVYVAGFFTLASGAVYVSRGIAQLRRHEQPH